MLSIAKSRHTTLVQFSFMALNAVGVLLATVYNATTPDLYPNNAHHSIGWVLTWLAGAQFLTGAIISHSRRYKTEQGFIPISTEAMAEHQRQHGDPYRFSNDSGQGTEPNTESLRSHSISSNGDLDQLPEMDRHEEEDYNEKGSLLDGSMLGWFLISKGSELLSSRALRIFQFLYNIVDRVILILAFLGLSTGVITYGGLFVSIPQLHSTTYAKL